MLTAHLASRASASVPASQGGLYMMMQCGGIGMMVAGALAVLLGLVLLASLIVLVWVAIGRLRRDRRET